MCTVCESPFDSVCALITRKIRLVVTGIYFLLGRCSEFFMRWRDQA